MRISYIYLILYYRTFFHLNIEISYFSYFFLSNWYFFLNACNLNGLYEAELSGTHLNLSESK